MIGNYDGAINSSSIANEVFIKVTLVIFNGMSMKLLSSSILYQLVDFNSLTSKTYLTVVI